MLDNPTNITPGQRFYVVTANHGNMGDGCPKPPYYNAPMVQAYSFHQWRTDPNKPGRNVPMDRMQCWADEWTTDIEVARAEVRARIQRQIDVRTAALAAGYPESVPVYDRWARECDNGATGMAIDMRTGRTVATRGRRKR